jgi:hypothetical protein
MQCFEDLKEARMYTLQQRLGKGWDEMTATNNVHKIQECE